MKWLVMGMLAVSVWCWADARVNREALWEWTFGILGALLALCLAVSVATGMWP